MPRKAKQRRKQEKRRVVTAQRAANAQRDAAGRLHLSLYRDLKTGQESLGLRAPLFKESWQNDVAASAANTAYQALKPGVTEERAVELTRHVMDLTSRLADGLLARAENGSVACKPGCDHCCYQSVGVTPTEALAIVSHLKQHRSQEALLELRERIQLAYERTRGLSSAERFSPEHPCPFLESARCTIYEVRPLSCRGMNSLDAEECADNLRNPTARAAFLASGVGGRSFLEPIRAFHAVSAGLQLGLSEPFGLDMRPLDLIAAMHELLDESKTAAAEWLAGKPSLEAARGGDNTHHARIGELTGAVSSHSSDGNAPRK